MTPTTMVVPTYKQMLRALATWLRKAEDETGTVDRLLSARLAPDMFPLATQVRFACLQAQEAAYRLRGEALPPHLNDLVQEGQRGGEQPGTLADAITRIDEALVFLDGLSETELDDDGAAQPLALKLSNGMAFDMTGEQYVRDWALPQFYFHVVTAYAILRSEGVKLGKPDYVQHMFAYRRMET